ncbi:mevalonate kinase [Nocardia sp. NPDC052316]|uniref:mevalonate kinase n=1 Tax=Nocardia sp. NPDC052316 TaxID=3364329 RepID=UPI0037CA6F0C
MGTAATLSGTGSAHAKIVLLGEHAAIYGAPAIAAPLPVLTVIAHAQRADVSAQTIEPHDMGGDLHCSRDGFKSAGPEYVNDPGLRAAIEAALRRLGQESNGVAVHFTSSIPLGRGLGASAARSCAALRAVADAFGQDLDEPTLFDLIQLSELYAHGRASGVDARAVMASTPLWFEGGADRPITIGADFELVVADSGIVGSTREAVALVRDKFEREPRSTGRLLAHIESLTRSALADISAGDVDSLGEKLTSCHEVLNKMGVGLPVLDGLVAAALDAGAAGAKLTGGGLGGSVVAITADARVLELERALLGAGAIRTWRTTVKAGGDEDR